MVPENLTSLHKHEEVIRAQSLRYVEDHAALIDHLTVVHASMDCIHAHVQGHVHGKADELVIQTLGIRLFNDCAAGLKNILSGYYQIGIGLIRDIVEVGFLVDYFESYPEKIVRWEKAPARERLKHFSPKIIREALDKRDGYKEGERAKVYQMLSEFGTHATAVGARIFAPDGLAKIGPFFDGKLLEALIGEMAMRIPIATLSLANHFEHVSETLLLAKQHYLNELSQWKANHFPNQIQAPLNDAI